MKPVTLSRMVVAASMSTSMESPTLMVSTRRSPVAFKASSPSTLAPILLAEAALAHAIRVAGHAILFATIINAGGFLALTLSDRSGEVAALAWENVDRLAGVCEVGSVVRIGFENKGEAK